MDIYLSSEISKNRTFLNNERKDKRWKKVTKGKSIFTTCTPNKREEI